MATALTQISGYVHVAERYGFEEAVFLDAIVYWYRTNRANNRNFRDGRWWTYNSIKAFEDIFPWWSAKQIRRIANSCREQGALIAGEYNEDRRDRSLWYTPGDELLGLYGLVSETGKCTCPNGQMQSPKGADELAQTGKCIYGIPCVNHACTYMTPYSPPEGDAPPCEEKDGAPIEAQRSGFDGERRRKGADEECPSGRSEGSGLCVDEGQLVVCGWMPGGTTPFQACDVVADFDIGDGHTVRETCRFSNGRFHYDGSCDDIDWPVVRWMALPPIVSESDTGAEMG